MQRRIILLMGTRGLESKRWVKNPMMVCQVFMRNNSSIRGRGWRWGMKEGRMDDEGRKCSKCGEYKPWSAYNDNRRGPRGKDSRCRGCIARARDTDEYRKAGRERARRDYDDPAKKARQRERMRAYHARPEVKERRVSAEQMERNRKAWTSRRAADLDVFRKKEREYQARYRQDPGHRLSGRMSCCIRKRLKSRGLSKGGRHWEKAVGYTAEQLRARLESLFEPGMTWDNHGDWHVDHVRPVRSFEFETMDDPGFKACWALDNLAPRWSTTETARRHGSGSVGNINKGARIL